MYDVMLTGIFEALNNIQQFKESNCIIYPSNNRPVKYGSFEIEYGYKPLIMNIFLYYIRLDFKLDHLNLSCTVQQMLLDNIVKTNNIISIELSELIILVETEKVSITDIYELVIRSSNLDLIFWYQKIVFNAIMKIICIELKIILNSDSVEDESSITNMFKEMEILYLTYTILPFSLDRYFKELATKRISDMEENKIDEINVAIDEYLKLQVFENEDIETLKFPVVTIQFPPTKQTNSSFVDFMVVVLNKFQNNQCFLNVFEYLSKQQIPCKIHTGNPKEIFDIVQTKLLNKNVKEYPSEEV